MRKYINHQYNKSSSNRFDIMPFQINFDVVKIFIPIIIFVYGFKLVEQYQALLFSMIRICLFVESNLPIFVLILISIHMVDQLFWTKYVLQSDIPTIRINKNCVIILRNSLS